MADTDIHKAEVVDGRRIVEVPGDDVEVGKHYFCPKCNRTLIANHFALNTFNCRACHRGWTEDELKEYVPHG